MRLNQGVLALAFALVAAPWLRAVSATAAAGEPAPAAASATTGHAASDDPASAQIDLLDAALVKSMQGGAAVSMPDRYKQLEPVVSKVFDLPLMTRLAIGAGWTGFSAEDQKSIVAAFSRLTVASYAHNFRTFDGEKFQVDPAVVSRGSDKFVKAQILVPKDTPTDVTYRLRDSGGTWKVIDVVYGGVSELSMRRSDFTAAINAGGASALLAHLKSLGDDLMKP